MVSCINSFAFTGIETVPVEVQVNISPGLLNFHIVGLADKAVAESKERVRSSLSSLGLSLPPKRIAVNLAPADLQKEGSHFDLPIALGLLAQMNIIPIAFLRNFLVAGELSLDARIMPVPGILPASIGAVKENLRGIICPEQNGSEAIFANKDLEILAAPNLTALINHIKGNQVLPSPIPKKISEEFFYPDLKDVKGQNNAKRALEIAAAGRHNLLMSGPPGSGKSMLASRLPGILPKPSASEILEISMIKSIIGNLVSDKIKRARPFREPHHSSSMPALIGGGAKAKPGEITLSHGGVLFLDELPEFSRQALDSLRQPLETGKVTVARAKAHITYPANFQLVAAMNPCRCGYLGTTEKECNKAPSCGIDYRSKLSGPLLDRFDIFAEVPAINPVLSRKSSPSESSFEVRKRVETASEIQKERYKNTGIEVNAKAEGDILKNTIKLEKQAEDLLFNAAEKMKLSMRGFNRVQRVARTIADLENSENVTSNHIAESLSYRMMNF